MFVLIVILGLGDNRQIILDPKLVFDSITHCNSVAAQLAQRYGHVSNPADFVVTYCLPKNRAKDKVKDGA
jgi:hypothetical protein